MNQTSEDNLLLVSARQGVDEINAGFYARFPYPQQPFRFDYLEETDFERVILNQDLGAWRSELIPRQASIWVAGCGTNQAIQTALRFRNSSVVGSDVSHGSLDLCQKNASTLGINNLNLRKESINVAKYQDAFDYVVSTGVIHHNAEPKATLARLAAALKPTGVLELMVYNRYHWTVPAAFQQVVRMLAGTNGTPEFESELAIAKRLIRNLPTGENTLSSYLRKFQSVPEAVFADALLQPVVYTFTLSSLIDLIASCGLRIMTYCVTLYDRVNGSISWELEFDDPDLQARYDSLPDFIRWQITNLLRAEKLPFLWFYLQRDDCGYPRKTASQLCETFMDTVFEVAHAKKRHYENMNGFFKLSHKVVEYPPVMQEEELIPIVRSVDGRTPMRTILTNLGISTTFRTVDALRIRLTTSAFPYLVAKQAIG